MTKLILDDVEYNTDDFNEDQQKLIGEINYNNNLSNNLNYQLSSLKIVSDLLVGKLKKSLSEEVEDDN
jgi:hypothetical protein|tara:strand:- start:250 stop:453 length:204 start_codon:yes stop_codon:yes gene_type:complete